MQHQNWITQAKASRMLGRSKTRIQQLIITGKLETKEITDQHGKTKSMVSLESVQSRLSETSEEKRQFDQSKKDIALGNIGELILNWNRSDVSDVKARLKFILDNLE